MKEGHQEADLASFRRPTNGLLLEECDRMSATSTEKPLVLVTGGGGLIGSRLIEDLSSDYRVIGFDIPQPPNSTSAEEWIECDLTDDDSVLTALSAVRGKYGLRLASVIHLAAYYDFSGEPSLSSFLLAASNGQ